MQDVLAKLKEIQEAYDNEDIQRAIAAAEKTAVAEEEAVVEEETVEEATDEVVDEAEETVEEDSVEEVHEEEVVEESVDNSDLDRMIRLSGRSGVLGMSKPSVIVNESVEVEETVEVEEDMSDLRVDLMQKMDHIEEMMGGEALLNEIIMGMTTDELKENVEWIAQHHDIKFPGEEDEIEEAKHDEDDEDEDEVEESFETVEEETVEVPVRALEELMHLAGYEEYKIDEYANEPEEEYSSAEDQMDLGGGLNGPKKAYAAAAGGDNPMDKEPVEIEEETKLTFEGMYKRYMQEVVNETLEDKE